VAVFIMAVCGMGILRRTSLRAFMRTAGLVVFATAGALLIISFVSREPVNQSITKGERGTSGYAQQLQKTSLEGSGDDRGRMRKEAIKIIMVNNTQMIIGIGPGQFGPYLQNNVPS